MTSDCFDWTSGARDRGAYFVSLVPPGDFVQRAHLADELAVAEQPFRSRQVRGVATADRERLLFDATA